MTIEQTYLELIARDEQPGHDDPLWMELDVAEAAERAAHQAVSEYQVRYIRPH